MIIGRGNWSTWRETCPSITCPYQLLHELPCDWTWASAIRTQRLTVWAVAWPYLQYMEDETRQSNTNYILLAVAVFGPPLWSSGQSSWLQIQKSRIRFPALLDFLRSIGSGTGSTQPRENKWGAAWIENRCSGLENLV
jgi:hypothetical protein